MLFGVAALNIILIGGLAWWLSRKSEPLDKVTFWLALLAKLVAGICLGLVYHYYYGVGDTLGFFNDAIVLGDFARRDAGGYVQALINGTPPIELVNNEPRAFFFTALLSVVNFLANDNYWLCSLWFSMFSFVCTWHLVRCLVTEFPSMQIGAVVSFLFLPSVVFWSSGIIKESIAFGGLCLLASTFCKLMNGRKLSWVEYPIILLALWLLLSLKYYWAAVFFPAVFTTLIVHWTIERRVRGSLALGAAWLGTFLVFCWLASFTHPNFYPERFLEVIRQNHAEFVAISAPENLIHFRHEVVSWGDVVWNAPLALFSGLFRPHVFEAHTITGVVSSAENLIIFLLVMAKLWRLRPVSGSNRVLLLAVLSYTLLLCIFLAMSTPNFGTLSRYRIGFLPFFVFIVLHENPFITLLTRRRKGTS